MILALETSCDDTCAAVLDQDGEILANVVSSQSSLHDRYGGVVPEVASRQHLKLVNTVVEEALDQAGTSLGDVELFAVTVGPGLIGALLIGVTTAKTMAAAYERPLAPVDHLHGHIAANFLLEPQPKFPFVCLIASGGHTLLVRVEGPKDFEILGQTLDDAAGEAFDKGARLLGLPYPGGRYLDTIAAEGNPDEFDFPVAELDRDSMDFSYSGLKTALVQRLRDMSNDQIKASRPDIAAGYQDAICRQLVDRCRRALESCGIRRLAVGGGVSANSQLRLMLTELAEKKGLELFVPEPSLCTDNAAMIASAARSVDPIPYPHYLGLDASASSKL